MNALQQLPNPDNVPGAVTTGYQRQNTNMFAIQTGLDTTEPFDNGEGVISIPAGGVIELNGVMFKIVVDAALAKPNTNTAYWVEVVDNGDKTAAFNLVTRPGKWSPAKQGCYTKNNNRTLNWVSLGDVDLTGIDEDTAVFSQAVKGIWAINLQKGWYCADFSSGLGGGNGGNGGAGGSGGGGGGVASIARKKQYPFFNDGQKQITIKIGGNGFNGGNGGIRAGSNANVGGGGGGGSGSGEASEINNISTGEQEGGNGGNGGNSTMSGWSGGGGGGGVIGGRGGNGQGTSSATNSGGAGGGGRNGNGSNNSGISGGAGGDRGVAGRGNGGTGPASAGGSGGSSNFGWSTVATNGGLGGRGGNGNNGGNGGGNNGGGGGGGQGADGSFRLNGSTAAGYCNIYTLAG